jgi:hypothetical protein
MIFRLQAFIPWKSSFSLQRTVFCRLDFLSCLESVISGRRTTNLSSSCCVVLSVKYCSHCLSSLFLKYCYFWWRLTTSLLRSVMWRMAGYSSWSLPDIVQVTGRYTSGRGMPFLLSRQGGGIVSRYDIVDTEARYTVRTCTCHMTTIFWY